MNTIEEVRAQYDAKLAKMAERELERAPALPVPDWYDHQLWDGHNTGIDTGDHFLFQVVETVQDAHNKDVVMYAPRIGIFIEHDVADQALVWRFVERPRNWQYRMMNYYLSAELKEVIVWHEQLHVFGVWKQRPTWKQLRVAMKRTYYFGSESSVLSVP